MWQLVDVEEAVELLDKVEPYLGNLRNVKTHIELFMPEGYPVKFTVISNTKKLFKFVSHLTQLHDEQKIKEIVKEMLRQSAILLLVNEDLQGVFIVIHRR